MTAPQANWDLSFDRHKLQELRSSWGGSSDRLGRLHGWLLPPARTCLGSAWLATALQSQTTAMSALSACSMSPNN